MNRSRQPRPRVTTREPRPVAASSTHPVVTSPAGRSPAGRPRPPSPPARTPPGTTRKGKEMSEHDIDPITGAFTGSPEFTEADFTAPDGDTWTSDEHPADTDQSPPDGWGSPRQYGQPHAGDQGVFMPGPDDPWESTPTPPYGTPRRRSARRTRVGPIALAALLLGCVAVIAVIVLPGNRAIRLTPADDPGATASQPAPSIQPESPSPAAEPPALTKAQAERVLAAYWHVNNAANQARSDVLLGTIEAGSSYAMDAGTYQMSRVTDPTNSQYAPFTAENAVYYIPRQPAGAYPRWFAAQVTYATLASPQHATGTGYVLFIQSAKDAAWKNVLEPYLLPAAGPAPFIETDAQGYAIQDNLTSAAGLSAAPGQIPQLTAQLAGRHSNHSQESRQPRRPARPGLLPVRGCRRIGRHRPPRHLRPGLRPEDRQRRCARVLPPDRPAQPRPAARPDLHVSASLATTPPARPSPPRQSTTSSSSPFTSQPEQPARPSSPTPPASPDRADRHRSKPWYPAREDRASGRRPIRPDARGRPWRHQPALNDTTRTVRR